jgi:hypothetical protein
MAVTNRGILLKSDIVKNGLLEGVKTQVAHNAHELIVSLLLEDVKGGSYTGKLYHSFDGINWKLLEELNCDEKLVFDCKSITQPIFPWLKAELEAKDIKKKKGASAALSIHYR